MPKIRPRTTIPPMKGSTPVTQLIRAPGGVMNFGAHFAIAGRAPIW